MQFSTRVAVMLSSILCLLLKTAKATGFESVEVTARYTEHHDRNLSCHRCTRSVHGENCLTMRDQAALAIQHCPKEKKYCMVERYWQDGALTTFARECTDKCKPGCIKAGSTYVLEYCYDCCQHDAFCNTHRYDASDSSRNLPHSLGVATVVFMTSLLPQLMG